MTEFTEEQELEIKTRIAKSEEEAKSAQQWVISGDRFYRIAILAATQSVNAEADDPYILHVGKILHEAFKRANNIGQKAPEKKQ